MKSELNLDAILRQAAEAERFPLSLSPSLVHFVRVLVDEVRALMEENNKLKKAISHHYDKVNQDIDNEV